MKKAEMILKVKTFPGIVSWEGVEYGTIFLGNHLVPREYQTW